ncbi:MAG: alpha-L-fucosidase, partial [Kiritimatiellae bacterium]|nr:alpha-L-fucosidase [Kiritimatiellia bacterium]
GDMTEYIKNIAMPQVKEILSNYGKIAVLWWDTPTDMTKERAEMLLPLLQLQPGIIWNNRLGGGYHGDTETPEQFIPATGYPGRDWETCMTMNGTWGYKSYDHNWKPVEVLLRNLVDIASKGGNYLLNVGPTSEGQIPEPSVERLKEVGKWIKANGDAIYCTSASPFKRLGWGRCTQKPFDAAQGRPSILYFHVFDWPKDGKLVVPGLKNKINNSYLLTDQNKSKLAVTPGEEGTVVIAVGEKAPDPIVSVVVAEIEGVPDVTVPPLVQESDGSIILLPGDAEIHGSAKVQNSHGKENIGYWTDVSCFVTWKFKVIKPGKFNVEITSACEGKGGSEYTVSVGNESLKGMVDGTGKWDKFKSKKLGVISIPEAGMVELVVKPLNKKNAGVMNLQSITLKPCG